MGYLGMGDAAAVTGVAFNSTKFPGICKPLDFPTLEKFKELQRQLNRAAHVKGITKIAVDGAIGPGTMALLSKVMGTSASLACSTAAPLVVFYTLGAKQVADAANAPASVAGPKPIAPPSILDATTGALKPQPASADLLDAFANMSTGAKVVMAGALGVVGFAVLAKKRRRK